MIKVGKIILALQTGFLWFRVQDQVEKQDFDGALRNLEKLPRAKSFSIETDMMKAQIFYEQRRLLECNVLCNSLVHRIVDDTKMSEQEKAYCTAYLKWISAMGDTERIKSQELAVTDTHLSEIEKIDLCLVGKHWKANFPLRVHPNWQEADL